jgi:hypothetical protein
MPIAITFPLSGNQQNALLFTILPNQILPFYQTALLFHQFKHYSQWCIITRVT